MRQLKLYATAVAIIVGFLWVLLRGTHCQMLSMLWRNECKGSKVTCYDESMSVMWRCWTFREIEPPP